MKIKKQTLLLLACIVWGIAGFNVLQIGIKEYFNNISLINIILSVVVFSLFQYFVFGKLVKKHTNRITSYEDEYQMFYKFFDTKSFIIMAIMMSGGISLRVFNLVSSRFIAVFYTGLGASLFLAGILFGINYIKLINSQKQHLNPVYERNYIMNNKTKNYMNAVIAYTILALIGGVFYREFTKFNGFTGKTVLSVIHTHYFALGMIFFILLILIEKNFTFSDNKTDKIIIAYHIGLNLTVALFLARGIMQVLNYPLTSAMNAAISGIAGIGHIILGVSLMSILLRIKRCIINN